MRSGTRNAGAAHQSAAEFLAAHLSR
ncbi:hypothetical protein J2W42_005480 [Rhizobium tibeticum]|nr:hypothetical protein [Rhizobium tibeticum]